MKKIGLIENMIAKSAIFNAGYEHATAAQVMAYTGGNTGNTAFVYGTRKILGETIVTIGWDLPPATVQAAVDHVVICCANQLGPHADLADWDHWLSGIACPVTLIGLGAQAANMDTFPVVPEGTRNFLARVVRHNAGRGPNIAVRGQYTQRLLESLGIASVVTGCPSLQISPQRGLGQRILHTQQSDGAVQRVVVAAGNPWHAESALLERTLVSVVEQWHGEYVLQHDTAMLAYAFGETASITAKTIGRFLEVYGERFDHASLLAWMRRYACYFVEAGPWIRFMHKFDRVVGARYHGVLLGIQAGVAGRVITMDARTTELCQTTGVPALSLENALKLSAQDLVAAVAWSEADAQAFDQARTVNSQTMVAFFEDQQLPASNQLLQLAAA